MRLPALLSFTLFVCCGGQQQGRERVVPEPYHGCGIQSTAENPDPCGSTAGQINPNSDPEESGRIEPDAGAIPEEREPQDYESEWDRPDYCGTPGCGQDVDSKHPLR